MNPVLSSLRPILQLKKNVWTDKKIIKKIAPKIAQEELALPKWDAPVYPKENNRQLIDFVMTANAINFAFTEFQEPFRKFEAGDIPWGGAFGMLYCLKGAMPRIVEADFLANLSIQKTEEIFQGNNMQIPMIKERTLVLQDVGKILLEKYDGHFYNLVEDSNYHAFKDGNGIVEKLAKDFPCFNDTSYYQGQKIMFYKRAQLAVGILYARLLGTGLFNIKDIGDLTVYADYVLPVSLTQLGIMRKMPKLEKKIQNWVEIEKCSLEELEIRVHTIHGADLLIKEINKHRPKDNQINALHMDYRLWSVTRQDVLKGYKHQLVRTIDY